MAAQIVDIGRLYFSLPEFVRLSWTSEAARQVWAYRFQRIIRAWTTIELLASAFGIRKCALITVSEEGLTAIEQIWQSKDLTAIKLKNPNASDRALSGNSFESERPLMSPLRLVIGRSPDVLEFQSVWADQDANVIGEFLGYPACCRERFCERHLAGYLIDHTWPMAADSGSVSGSLALVQASGQPLANIFWKSAGIRAVPHLPCNLNCKATLALGQQFLDVARQLQFSEEMDWLQQILSWPLAWSALHGIAEIKTPILKIITRTEATAKKLMVEWAGHSYPAECAQGLAFPYKKSPLKGITQSPAFQRGLVNLEP
ncbi:MAG TPA: hypothetical protein VGK22_14665 [Candidatus Angelobacter sp.]|jgi:hypothetical protein